MDYTKIPRQLIYRERKSLEEFAEEDEANVLIIDNMLDSYYFSKSDAKNRALKCYNSAYYICTLIKLSGDRPEWNFTIYCDIAYCNDSGDKVKQAFTFALVYIFLTHHPCWKASEKLIGKMKNFMTDIPQFLVLNDPFLKNKCYMDVCSDLLKNAPDDFSISEAFAPRVIDRVAVGEIMLAREINWPHLVNYFEERRVRELVNALGRTEEEKHNVLDIFEQAAKDFYSGGYENDYPQQVFNLLGNIHNEVSYEYNHKAIEASFQIEMAEMDMKREKETDKNDDDTALLKAENEKLRSELEDYKSKQTGLTRMQAAIFTESLAQALNFKYTNKKEQLGPLASKLFGWGERSMKNRMTEGDPNGDRKVLANIFFQFSADFAKIIYPNLKDTATPSDEDTLS